MRTSNLYNRVILHFFFVLLNFVTYFCQFFMILKFFEKILILLAFMKTIFFF